MVLMIKEGGSFLATEEEEFHLQWSWLMKIDGSFLIVLIIEEGWFFSDMVLMIEGRGSILEGK